MTRLPDWEMRLAAYLDEVRYRPYRWGSHDCALHGAAVVEAMTGFDGGEPFRGRYRTELGAARALKRFGAGTVEATFTAALGEMIPASLAQRGDIVLWQGSTGVCMGPFAYFVGREGEAAGLVRVDRALWEGAWRV